MFLILFDQNTVRTAILRNLSHHSSLQCHMILQKSLICGFAAQKNISYWKQLFLWKLWYF